MASPKAMFASARDKAPWLDHLIRAAGRYQADTGDRRPGAVGLTDEQGGVGLGPDGSVGDDPLRDIEPGLGALEVVQQAPGELLPGQYPRRRCCRRRP